MKKNMISALAMAVLCLGNCSVFAESPQKIPFEIDRSKVILSVRINDSRPLRIILDSGMPGRGILLFKKELGEELNLRSAEIYRIRGAGRGSRSSVMRVASQNLSIGDVGFSNQAVMVLQSDTMSGFSTDGVIGNSIFGPHAVRFDFEDKIITLMESGSFRPDSSWEFLDMTFNDHGIPFIKAAVSVSGENEIPLQVYIDSASGEALELLVRPGQRFILPEDLETRYLGRGLSGDISGLFGQVTRLRLGSFVLENVPTAFPQADVRSRQPGADGILCNGTLMRFHVVFDFSQGKLFLKPNNLFNSPIKSTGRTG
jgi:hypothetical protein